ncbi:MAG: ATP-binding protein, partial [Bacteroidales bacterium]|nr:ATP-binding protein [Bacteroidales bacterium]
MVIKTLRSQNPFSDYGQIVEGNRFAGRKSEIQQIHNRVLGTSYGNIAVMGMPRTGKTSLVWNALVPLKEEQLGKKNIIAFVYLGRLSSSTDFFKQLIYQTLEELELVDGNAKLHKKLKSLFEQVKTVQDEFEFKNYVQKFFRFLKRSNFRVTFILDEFDCTTDIFKVADFQLLRELATQPETQICLITISRRTIQEIEAENGAISNFSGIFTDLRLGLFNDIDIGQYWSSIDQFGITVTDEYKNAITYLVGRHPFLIDMCNYEVYNKMVEKSILEFAPDKIDLELELKLSLFYNFDKIINLLKDEKLYDKALQLVLGPIYNVTIGDEQKLLKYEFIKQVSYLEKYNILKRDLPKSKSTELQSYICFSDYFTELMNIKYNDIDYWALWKDTECALRDLIKIWISDKFNDSENWEDNYLKTNAKSEGKREGIQKLRDTRTVSIRKFGSASTHL